MRNYFLLILIALAGALSGQSYKERINYRVVVGDTSQLHQVILRDYTRLRGVVTEVRSDSIFIYVSSIGDTVTVPTATMRHVGLYRPDSWTRTTIPRMGGSLPDLDDLTLIRTALPYSRSRRFKSVMLVYNSMEWNLNEHFQLGVGLAGPLGLLFSQRYRTSLNEYLHIGLSHEFLVVPIAGINSSDFPAVGDLTTLFTVGNASQFFNLGVGLFYATAGNDGPVRNFRLGTGLRVSRKVHLYGEMLGYLDSFDDLGILPSLNVAVAGGRHRWSFGLMSVITESFGVDAIAIPYVSYSVYN